MRSQMWWKDPRVVDAVCFGFGKAFDTVSFIILIDKLINCSLGQWTVRCQAQRAVITGVRSSGRLVPDGVHQGWMMGLMLLSIFTNGLGAGAECTLSKLVDGAELGEV